MKTIHKILITLAACAIMIASLLASNYLIKRSNLFETKDLKVKTEIAKTIQNKQNEV